MLIPAGHIATECTMNRLLAQVSALETTPDQAWTQLKQADEQREIEEIKKVDNAIHLERSRLILMHRAGCTRICQHLP
jgi:hypothetical protein